METWSAALLKRNHMVWSCVKKKENLTELQRLSEHFYQKCFFCLTKFGTINDPQANCFVDHFWKDKIREVNACCFCTASFLYSGCVLKDPVVRWTEVCVCSVWVNVDSCTKVLADLTLILRTNSASQCMRCPKTVFHSLNGHKIVN